MSSTLICIAIGTAAFGLLLFVFAPRLASAGPPSLRVRLDKAGLHGCRIQGHPRRRDVAYVYCPTPETARRARSVLVVDLRVSEAVVLGADGRTVEVVLL